MKSNRVVLITGAAGGIGTALVDRFLANDDTVIAADLHKDVLDDWRARWPQDARIVTVAADVCSGVAEQVAYVASKAGVIGFTRSLAHALGDHGITVNSVTPGLTATPAVRDNFPEAFLQGQRDVRALHRDEEPEDLAGPVFFLASDDAAFITGQIINVDGGSSKH